MKPYKLVLTGFGSVGWHVADLLFQRRERYATLFGADVQIVAVCGSRGGLYDPNGLSPDTLLPLTKANGGLTASARMEEAYTGVRFLSQCDADGLVEAGPTDFVTGGSGYLYLKTALEQGMDAITLSKGALVLDYPGLARLSRKQRAFLKISGATAAALPTVDLIQYNLAGCEVAEMTGIFTGTTNFILTAMWEEGLPYELALREAQNRGIAEPDPAFDVEGWDTACKLTILANAAFGAEMSLSEIKRTGISGLTGEQMEEWRRQGLVPKLVGRILRQTGQIAAEVNVVLYPFDHPFAQVKGATKAVQVRTDVMGELLVVGGKSDPRAAAAAALKDLEHILERRFH
ncbi:homoserine dehydrogenase [Brevibacillus sp. H7]|uniref:homoserine dehydrogenase n=1 Tax=Brevibacillus sp. H7 TaxID=3349138 RepID=UPI00382CF4AD